MFRYMSSDCVAERMADAGKEMSHLQQTPDIVDKQGEYDDAGRNESARRSVEFAVGNFRQGLIMQIRKP